MPASDSFLAVIPTVFLAGPAALLAALFPAAFAALAVFWRRWGRLLAVLSLGSTLFFLHGWFRGHARGAWWGTTPALWLCLAALTVAGALLSLRRARRFIQSEKRGVAARGAEAMVLLTLGIGCACVGMSRRPPDSTRIAWTFEAIERGVVLSSPLASGDRIYLAAAQSDAFNQFGTVYCLNRATGKMIWSFNNGGKMKQVFSSPALEKGRLFIGEGMHEDADCRVYCLDAATGHELWSFVTKSHTESSPRLAHGCVYIGAGDDGLYCLDQATGAPRWHFPGPHVDMPPTIVGDRVYAGSAYGTTETFCLEAATGKPIWRAASDLPVVCAAAADNQVFFGLGKGKLTGSTEKPAGAVVCMDAADGSKQWRRDVADAVFSGPLVLGDAVYFGSRDHHLYGLRRRDGALRWTVDLGSPIVAAPATADGLLYVSASGGKVYCLDPAHGSIVWQMDLGAQLRAKPEIVGAPALAADNNHIRVYIGAGLGYSISSAAIVCCLIPPTGGGD